MEVANILRSGFLLANQRIRLLFLDLLWKFLHLVSVVVLISVAVAWLIQILSQYQWEGPELTPANPILLAMVFAEVWKTYAGTLAWAAIGVATGSIVLWITLESLFRGGLKKFWIYAGTRIASLAIMISATAVLIGLTASEGLQAGIVSASILTGIWWITSVAETLVRREATDLLATHLTTVAGALGSLLGVQLLLSAAAVSTLALSMRLMLNSSSPAPFIAAGFLMLAAAFFWTIVHSYLVVVRYSTIDIMRANVVEA
jgi:hypothetical protein